jgi:hypothetical protein
MLPHNAMRPSHDGRSPILSVTIAFVALCLQCVITATLDGHQPALLPAGCCCTQRLTMDVYALPRHHSASVRSGSIDSACSSLMMACRSIQQRCSIVRDFLVGIKQRLQSLCVHCQLLEIAASAAAVLHKLLQCCYYSVNIQSGGT